jgi:hypothetical protein
MFSSTPLQKLTAKDDAQQLLMQLETSQKAACANLRLRINEAIEALEAQPASYNVAYAMDFRTIEFPNGTTITCAIRGWKIKWDLYIIPGLDGLLALRTTASERGVGIYRPFEDFLPPSDENFNFVDLVTAVYDLTYDASEATKPSGGEKTDS